PPPPEILNVPSSNSINPEQPSVVDKNRPASCLFDSSGNLNLTPPPPEILNVPSSNSINPEQPSVVDKNRPASCLFDSSGNLNLTSFSEDSDFEANIKKEDDNFAPIGLDRFVHEL
ncbi:MAG: hypothetical protein MHMPM18_005029, partial [Marteilia pararefringens]